MPLPSHNDSGLWQPFAERAPSFIDAESCTSVHTREPALANPRLGGQRERRRLHEPAWLDMSRRREYVNVANPNEPIRLSHASVFKTRGEPPFAVSVPRRQSQYITPTCPCGIPFCRAKAIREQYSDQHPEGREQAVQATLDFSFDRIGFTVMDGTSATWIGQPDDDTPPPLLDRPTPRRTAESKRHSPEPTQSRDDVARRIEAAVKAISARVQTSRKRAAAQHRPHSDKLSPRESVEVEPKSKAADGSKKAGSKKSSSSSKASSSSTKSSSSFNGSYSSKRSNTLVAGAETDIDEGSSLGINLLMKD